MAYAETLFLDVKPGMVPQVVAALSGLSGVGIWVTEVGPLNRLTILRPAETYEALLNTRAGILAALPGDLLSSIDVTTWRCSLPLMPPGVYGSIYEWRCYEALPGRMAETEKMLQDAAPDRVQYSPLTTVLISLDGPSRIAHLWPYADLAARASARAAAVAGGKWPPKIAPMLRSMANEILLPVKGSCWA